MTNKQKAASLTRLNNALDRRRLEYESALGAVLSKVQEFHHNDVIIGNDFPGDGLGIGIDQEELRSADVYMSIDDVIKLIRQKGQISKDDPTYL